MELQTAPSIQTQNWWNFDEQLNPYQIPNFTPLPNQRFTHEAEVGKYGPMVNDVIVNIPKAGMGTYIGSSVPVNYDYTWSEWPPQKGRLVNMFLGIPYAAPPIGDRRFRVPIPAYLDTRYPWYAKFYRPACVQPSDLLSTFITNFTDISEDCLYLNIFTPNRTWEDPKIRYPVVVHIHGGRFVYGSSHMCPGHVLASKGVVVVTFNYRLGPFGFLATGDFASIGNFGLWDQLLAMRWVKDNIAWFRGNPDQITLMGEGAGGASVGLHTVSPSSRGLDLFQRVVLMSGSDLSPWAVSNPDELRTRYYAIELGRQLGCPSVMGADVGASQSAMAGEPWKPASAAEVPQGEFGNSSVKLRLTVPYYTSIDANALVRCLRLSKSADEIMHASKLLRPLRGATPYIWTPVLDGTAGFLPRTPLDERRLGRFAKVPVLAGVVHDEGSSTLLRRISQWESHVYPIDQFTDAVARRTIGNIVNYENVFRFNATTEELYTRYTWWPNLANNTARWERMVALISDYEINSPLENVVGFHSSHSNKAYFYEFAYLSPNDTELQPQKGVYHGALLPFLFGFPFMNSTFWSTVYGESAIPISANRPFFYPHDTNMSEFLMDLWTNFAKMGNPTPYEIKNTTWRPYKLSEGGYLFIYLNSTMRYKFRPLEMAFWRQRFFGLAEIVPPSPPLYYFPLFGSQIATVILGCLVSAVLILLLTLIGLICRRPKPDHFLHEVRLATPGAALGSAFQTAFKDAFSNRNIPAMNNSDVDWGSVSSMDDLELESRINYSASQHSRGRLLAPAGHSTSRPRNHPPPPPIPSDGIPKIPSHCGSAISTSRRGQSPAVGYTRGRRFSDYSYNGPRTFTMDL
ncbi:hypothetical protein CRM22_007313 [Opisthorchis felineus]|uniref:Carboxylesterase type B domain-containing protein n=1 Tax=Opisthorchis felineus TaxID=147828 RepID=A0A4S2LGF2_OPIFE|nr:hypothetical protein CRM22_007313 [Opisthorchis felineus]